MKRALFLSPHTDDVELSAGGTVAKFVDSYEVHVLAFSDARNTQPKGIRNDKLINEMMEAMNVLGVDGKRVRILDFKTRYFHSVRQEILDELIKIRDQIEPNIVFAPSTYDQHQDHQVIVNEVLRSFKGSKSSILGYEQPWNNFSFETTCFVTLDKIHIDKKLEALSMYKSQQHRQYINEEFIKGLAIVRGTQVGDKYAEAFQAIRVTF